VGKRMEIPYTRAMVDAAVEGELIREEFEIEPTFGFSIPKACHGVPAHVLNPRNAWADKAAFDRAAEDLRNRFAKNFEKFDAPPEVKAAGPKVQR
jgi:phosphoenolpyruvate carboxykinase (ATP)